MIPPPKPPEQPSSKRHIGIMIEFILHVQENIINLSGNKIPCESVREAQFGRVWHTDMERSLANAKPCFCQYAWPPPLISIRPWYPV
jgi:hypothetical protein